VTSPEVPAVIDPALRRTRLGVAAAFATQGGIFISLTTRLPDFQDRYRLSDTALSGLLLMMVLLAGVGSVLAETRAKRIESAQLLRAGLVLITVGVSVVSEAGSLAVFIAGLAAYGVGLGMVDATTNMQAVALEHRYGRPILPSFHGAWTTGGLVGASFALATGSLSLRVINLVVVVPLALVVVAPFLRRVGDPLASGPKVEVPWRPIILVGLGMVVFYMVDTAAFTWGPTYLKNVFAAPHHLVALATFPYLLASGSMRLAGDTLVARYGATPVLRVGALIGCAGLAIVVFSPSWPVAVAGFLVVGGGVAVVAPLSFSAAARIAGGDAEDAATRQARVDTVIGRFNQFNYVGALVGAVLTGVVGSGDLRIGFAVPMVLVLVLIPLARAFASTGGPAPATDQVVP
jgi:MFS family permease